MWALALPLAASAAAAALLSCSAGWARLLAAAATLAATLQWRVAGAVASLVAAASLAHRDLVAGPGERLVYTPHGDTGGDSSQAHLAKLMEEIIASCHSLRSPKYVPTFWAASRWTNLALYTAKQLYDKSWLRRNNFSREVVRTGDGGTVSIDYAMCQLPPAAPLVIFLHTITGSGREVGHYMRAATARGWRSCVFNRRGHAGMPLTSPGFNVVGDAADTAAMVARVRARHPAAAFLAMVGVSAGSGLLVTYLGRHHATTPVQAAVALCPAYDIERAFRLAVNHPMMDKHILKSMKRLFLQRNKDILCSKSEDTFIKCSSAATVHEFIKVHYTFAGYKTLEDYYSANNPIDWLPKIETPLLLINSEDDIVCLAENIREDLVRARPGAVLLRTNKGSHISFNEGLFGQGCYLSRVCMDFLDTAKLVDART